MVPVNDIHVYTSVPVFKTMAPSRTGQCAGKFKLLVKWEDIYTENISVMSLMSGLKIEGNFKMEGGLTS